MSRSKLHQPVDSQKIGTEEYDLKCPAAPQYIPDSVNQHKKGQKFQKYQHKSIDIRPQNHGIKRHKQIACRRKEGGTPKHRVPEVGDYPGIHKGIQAEKDIGKTQTGNIPADMYAKILGH